MSHTKPHTPEARAKMVANRQNDITWTPEMLASIHRRAEFKSWGVVAERIGVSMNGLNLQLQRMGLK